MITEQRFSKVEFSGAKRVSRIKSSELLICLSSAYARKMVPYALVVANARIRRILCGAAAVLIAQSAISADSSSREYDSSGASWVFDIASIVVVSETIRKSQMSLYLSKPLQDLPTGNYYDCVVFVYEHDCERNQMRVIDTIPYLHDERVEISGPSPDWRPAGDNVAHKHACAPAK